jgi:isoleucyl-tRNA synthetase
MAESKDWKNTLNLPQTSFAMKAKLTEKEPEYLKKWQDSKLYSKILNKRRGSPTFILHDGPPYANGHIHLGTALNKILKDFIVRSRTMAGFLAPYLPGWDCHGLPIEIKVDKLLGEKKKRMSVIAVRNECRDYALKFIDIQRQEFKRLGIFGEWDKPYLTMDPEYEAEVIRYLADFFKMGNIYKGKRPVYWCASCQTALAEAEIEYHDKKSPSIYVKFPLLSDLGAKFPALKGKRVSVIIWTTTPWTLPANLAIAFHPEYEYAAFEGFGGEVYIAAKRLIPLLAEELGLPLPAIVATFSGKELEGLKARHPFINRESVFVLADYVTLDTGTGAVHTAPGHGAEDYLTGVEYGLDIYTPVDEQGCFTPDVERYAGQNVFKANRVIMDDMKKDGTLLKEAEIAHSYPHCWRCKNPVIFRATSQWFISMDKNGFRARALEAITKVSWVPVWGEERISNMIAGRPDWCISRQRSWGVPLPAFNCQACGTILADERIALRVAEVFGREGANSWFVKTAAELLPPGTTCPKCGGSDFAKEHNILDVWFESGSSFNVLGRRPDLPWPADIYIEGHDQHRGWFNSSLLVGIAAKNASPYKTCITHGFILDELGRAMSKSLGNVIEPSEVIKKNGAEVLRLWVAMLDFKEDAKFGPEILQRLVEAYRKLRNTWRFMLGNLFDFAPDADSLAVKDMLPLDRWALRKAAEVGTRIEKAYETFAYHVVFHAISDFFTVEMSSQYLDILKDRLYCSAPKSVERRSGQAVIFRILRDTLLLMAPILPFTTEEAWESLPGFRGKDESVHLGDFPDYGPSVCPDGLYQDLEGVFAVRQSVLKELEKAREEKVLGTSLEARVSIRAPETDRNLLRKYPDDLASLFIVSEVAVAAASASELSVRVEKASGGKCERCWNISTAVGQSREYPSLCRRCQAVVKELRR